MIASLALLRALLTSAAVASPASGPGQDLHFEPVPAGDRVVPEAARPRFGRAGRAWESWEYVFGFPSGYTLLARMQVTSSGPGRHRALVVGMILAPDGRTALIKNGRPRDRWSFETTSDGVRLRVAHHEITAGLSGHRLLIQNSMGRFEVEAEPLSGPVRIGRVTLARDQSYELVLLAPRLRVRGRVQFPGEPEKDLGSGTGVALRAFSDVADFELADVWLSLHTFDRATQVSLLEFTTTKRLGRKRIGVLFATRGGEIVLRKAVYERELLGLAKDPLSPGYPVPARIRLSAADTDGLLTGQVRLELRRRDDIIEWIGSRLLGLFVRRIAHPIQYLFEADYRFDLERGGVAEECTGRGIACLSILNRPPGDAGW